MSNTGAPFNLPYPISTDLVIDGAQDIEDLAEAVNGSIKIAQIVRTSDTSAIGIGPQTGEPPLSGIEDPAQSPLMLSVTITPKSATSTVFVVAEVGFIATTNTNNATVRFFVTDSDDVALEGGENKKSLLVIGVDGIGLEDRITMNAFDNPASISQQTYKVRASSAAGTDAARFFVSLVAYEITQ